MSQMSVATIVPFRSAAVATAAPAGTILPVGYVPIPGTTGGTPISFAMAAFFIDPTLAGIVSNPSLTPSLVYEYAYQDFLTDDFSEMGWGQIVPNIVLGGLDTIGQSHAEPSTEEGWTSFSLINIASPEPSSLVLSVVGGALVILTRRFGTRLGAK